MSRHSYCTLATSIALGPAKLMQAHVHLGLVSLSSIAGPSQDVTLMTMLGVWREAAS